MPDDVDKGDTGVNTAQAAASEGVHLKVVHSEAKRGFVPPPQRWAVERGFGRLGCVE